MKTLVGHSFRRSWSALGIAMAIFGAAVQITTAQTLTALPGQPMVQDLNGTDFVQHSVSNFTVNYDISVGDGWAGVMVRWEEFAGQDLSAITQFVFGVLGDSPDQIKVEFEDTDNNKTIINSPALTDEFQFWEIPASSITNNLSSIKVIAFVVDQGLAGAGNFVGDYTVYVDGLSFTPPPVDPSDPGDAPITVLPGEPTVGDIAGTVFEQHSSTNFTVTYDVTVDPFFAAVIVQWPAPTNLTTISEFVFGALGDPDSIKVEFEDGDGGKTTITLAGMTGSLQHWHIPAGWINNLDSLKAIVFVVDEPLAGAGNESGDFEVRVGGLDFTAPPAQIVPTTPDEAPITILPNDPLLNDIDGTLFEQHSSTNFTVFYELPEVDSFDAVMIRWENFDPIDLTSITQFVFGVTGTPNSVKVEFEDNDGGKTIFILQDVDGNRQNWHIPSSQIANLDNIKVIVFAVDRDLAGVGNFVGQFTVFVGGFDFPDPPTPIDPSDPGDAPITILPDQPLLNDLNGTLFEQHSQTNFTVSYSLPEEDSWSGVMVRWEDFNPIDLTSITQFVFGVTGTPNAIKVEFEDTNSNKTVFSLLDVDGTMQHWHIPASQIANLDNIKVISFVVDQGVAGAGNFDGQFTVFVGGLAYTPLVDVPASDPSVADITVLPDNPLLNDLNGTLFVQHSSTNFTFVYTLPEVDSWSGVMVRWEDFNPIDLSSITQFVFGVIGSPESIRIEFEDSNGQKSIFTLLNVTNDLQHWLLDASLILNLDDIKVISFVVDRALAGEGNEDGFYTVFVGGLFYDASVASLDASSPNELPITVLPGLPVVNDLDGTAFEQHSSTNFTVSYSLPEVDDWDGVMVRWADFDPIDLTSIDTFVIGVTGTPEAIKVEFEDSNGGKTIFNLDGVSGSLQHWHIPAALIANLDDITVIAFVVDRGLAGVGNFVGPYTVFIGGLDFASGSIIPIEWLNAYELPTDGSVDFVDLDGDGFNVWEEYVAGTIPTNGLSFWQIDVSDNQPANGGGFALRWDAISNRVYTVERSPDLLLPDNGFVSITNFLSLVTEVYEYIDEEASEEDSYLYRVLVELP